MPIQRFPTYKRMNPVESLLYLKSYLENLIGEYFDGNEELLTYVAERADRAREILIARPGKVVVHQGYLTAEIVSSEDAMHPKPRTEKLRPLVGEGVVTKEKVPETYRVTVGKYSIKCGCPDATMLVRKAKRAFHTLKISAIDPSRYVICKHTLAMLSLGLSHGVIGIDKEFEKTMLKALLTVFVTIKKDRKAVNRVLAFVKH